MTRLTTDAGAQQTNQVYEGLFKPIEQTQERPVAPAGPVMKGDLVLFGYRFWLHDRYPLVIVTDYEPGYRIRGLNVHYLTLANMRWLLRTYSGNRGFSYQSIKSMPFLRSAFRAYKWEGVLQMRKMDPKYLTDMMGTVRRTDPNKTRIIEDAVREQLGRQLNMTAAEMTGSSIDSRSQPFAGRPVPVTPTVPVIGSQPAQPGV